MPGFHDAAIVSIGAAFGGAVRHVALTRSPAPGPWRVVLVNAVGSAALARSRGLGLGPRTTLLFGSGFCGGFTTFSTFAVTAVDVARREGAAKAILYVTLANVAAGLAALAALPKARIPIK